MYVFYFICMLLYMYVFFNIVRMYIYAIVYFCMYVLNRWMISNMAWAFSGRRMEQNMWACSKWARLPFCCIVCMCVCMCVCMYACMYVLVVYIYLCTYVCMCVCTYISMYMFHFSALYISIYICMYVYMC